MQVVEDQHVDAAVEGTLVRLHIRLDGTGGEQRPLGALDGDVDDGERGNRLRLVVLEYLEVFLFQVPDEVPLLVGDDRIDLDVLDDRLEGGRGCGRLLLRRWLALARHEPGTGDQHEGCGNCDACILKHP